MSDEVTSVSQGLKNVSWKVRRETYQKILYFLRSGQKQLPLYGEVMTIQKIIPLLNVLSEEVNTNVAIEGMNCIKEVIRYPLFKVSQLNHFLTEGLEKQGYSEKLQASFEQIWTILMEKWSMFLLNLAISKFQNKNAKILVFVLRLLLSQIDRISANRDLSAHLCDNIQNLCSSPVRDVKLLAVEINNSLEKNSRKGRKKGPTYHDLIKNYEQMNTQKKIEVGRELRALFEDAIREGSNPIEPDEDHFALIFALRNMVEDSNQLLWVQAVRLLTMIASTGFKFKDISYVVDKFRMGKNPTNQILYNFFDELVMSGCKKMEEYVYNLQEISDGSNKQNVKQGCLWLILRLAYLVNHIDCRQEVCEEIKEFFSFPLYEQVKNQESLTSQMMKSKIVYAYNKTALKWLSGQSKYQQLADKIIAAFKPFQEKTIMMKQEPIKKKQMVKSQGFDKVFQDLNCQPKELQRKILMAEQFLQQNISAYPDAFYPLQLLLKLIRGSTARGTAGQRLSSFVLYTINLVLRNYALMDQMALEILFEILLLRLSFKKNQQLLRDYLKKVNSIPGSLEFLSGLLSEGMRARLSNLKILQQWLSECKKEKWHSEMHEEIRRRIEGDSRKVRQQESFQQIREPQRVRQPKRTEAFRQKIHEPQTIRSNQVYESKKPHPSIRNSPFSNHSEELQDNYRSKISKHSNLEYSHFTSSPIRITEPDMISDIPNNLQDLVNHQTSSDEEMPEVLPAGEIKNRLETDKNCFFFLKNEIYLRLKSVEDEQFKRRILKILTNIIQASDISNIPYDNLLNIMFLLFAEVRKCPAISTDLQNAYEILRSLKSISEFFVRLLKNIKPILESISQQEDCQFIANIIAKSLDRLAIHLPHEDILEVLCQINDFFQIGQVVYFDLYKNEYDVITKMLFVVADRWLSSLSNNERVTVIDTFDTLYDSSFKKHIIDS